MKRWWTMLWLAAVESRWVIVVPLVIFGICGLEDLRSGATSWAALAPQTVASMGLFAALIVGVACGAQDMKGDGYAFWQAMPIAGWRLTACRFVVGLAGVLLIALLPQAPVVWNEIAAVQQAASAFRHQAMYMPVLTAPVMAAVYAMSFLAGALIRDAARAAAPAVAAGLLLVFMPVMFSGLEQFSLLELLGDQEILRVYQYVASDPGAGIMNFASDMRAGRGVTVFGQLLVVYDLRMLGYFAFMFTVVAAAGVVAMVGVSRHWRVQAGKPMLAWSLGGVFLLLMTMGAAQLGSNIEPVSSAMFDAEGGLWRPAAVHASGGRGAVVLVEPTYTRNPKRSLAVRVHGLSIDAGGQLSLGAPVRFQAAHPYNEPWPSYAAVWRPSDVSDVAGVFLPRRHGESQTGSALFVVPLTPGSNTAEAMPALQPVAEYDGMPVLIGDRIWIISSNQKTAIELDLGDLSRPTVKQTVASKQESIFAAHRDMLISEAANQHIVLPYSMDGMPLDQQVRLRGGPMANLVAAADWFAAGDYEGDRLSVNVGRLEPVVDGVVQQRVTDNYRPFPLMRISGYRRHSIDMHDRDVWITSSLGESGALQHLRILPTGELEDAGYFVCPGGRSVVMTLTDDGRAVVVSGTGVWVLPAQR